MLHNITDISPVYVFPPFDDTNWCCSVQTDVYVTIGNCIAPCIRLSIVHLLPSMLRSVHIAMKYSFFIDQCRNVLVFSYSLAVIVNATILLLKFLFRHS